MNVNVNMNVMCGFAREWFAFSPVTPFAWRLWLNEHLHIRFVCIGVGIALQVVLGSMLPRESASKELDSALLAIVSYPAFAVTDPRLAYCTLQHIRRKLLVRQPLPSPFLVVRCAFRLFRVTFTQQFTVQ